MNRQSSKFAKGYWEVSLHQGESRLPHHFSNYLPQPWEAWWWPCLWARIRRWAWEHAFRNGILLRIIQAVMQSKPGLLILPPGGGWVLCQRSSCHWRRKLQLDGKVVYCTPPTHTHTSCYLCPSSLLLSNKIDWEVPHFTLKAPVHFPCFKTCQLNAFLRTKGKNTSLFLNSFLNSWSIT